VSLGGSTVKSRRLVLPGYCVRGGLAEMRHHAMQQELCAQCRNAGCPNGLFLSG
jgi:hypothetical protein